NPVLGGHFLCRHDYPNDTQGFFITEKASQHPLVSAFFCVPSENHFSIIGDLWLKSKFLGNSVSMTTKG
ncbi:hypothetical protein EI94DRAFT_1416515, partial [Lactarius quietus]